MGTTYSFLMGKAITAQIDHLLPFSAEVKNVWS